jgi:hypothetical protein
MDQSEVIRLNKTLFGKLLPNNPFMMLEYQG